MLVELVGMEVVSYTKKQTGELKEGLSIYYTAPKNNVRGKAADTIWVPVNHHLYPKMKALDFAEPITADATYEMQPGSRFPVLADIQY